MIFADKHRTNIFRTHHAIGSSCAIGIFLLSLNFLFGATLPSINDGENRIAIAKSVGVQIEKAIASSGKTYIPLQSSDGLPPGAFTDEGLIVPESVEDDDDFSNEILFIINHNNHRSVCESLLQFSLGSLQERLTVSLVILHHSWKMYLN
jgi:hypothetical protein